MKVKKIESIFKKLPEKIIARKIIRFLYH